MTPHGFSPRRIARFVRVRALWAAAVPALLMAGVALHEGAHALAVVADGGAVIAVRLRPMIGAGGVSFGGLLHDGAARPWLVAIAPAVLWLAVACAAVVTAGRLRRHRRLAEGLLFGLAALPLVDVSLGFAGLFLGRASSDLFRLLHGHETAAGIAMAAIFHGFGVVTWRRLRAIAPGALSRTEFAVGFAGLLATPWLILVTTAA